MIKPLFLAVGIFCQNLVSFLSRIDFSVTVCEDTEEYGNQNLFPEAESISCMPYLAIMETLNIGKDGLLDNNDKRPSI